MDSMDLSESTPAACGSVPGHARRRSDASIIAASVHDPGAFEELFDRHWASLYAFCTRRVGAGGEDIAAETFRLAFDKRQSFRTGFVDARPWLFGIATRLLHHHLRDGRRRANAFARYARGLTVDGPPDVMSELEGQMLGERLQEALGELSDVERDALLLWAWADMGYAEIATALEIPLGTVRSRIHRARRRLRTYLDERTDHDD